MRRSARLRRLLAHPRPKSDHASVEEESLELVDLTLLNRALGQTYDIHAPGLPTGRHQDAVQEVEVEALRGRELEEAERVLRRSLHAALNRAEVRGVHLERPRQ